MADYKVSVVIPTFNTGDFLLGSLEAFKSQTIGFDNIELIYVDDFSSDEYTLDLLASIDKEYDNCRVFYLNENSGFPGTPRNYGLDVASSDYVIFSDHDDTYEKDAFEVLYNKITEENADLVFSNYYKVYDNKKIKEKTCFNGETVKINNINEDLRFFDIGPSIWTKLFRKDFLIENNIRFPERMLAEDMYVYISSILQGTSIVYLDDFYGYNYSIRDSKSDKSTIHLRNKQILKKMIEGYFETFNLINSLAMNQYFSNIFKRHFVYWLTSLTDSDISDKDKKDLLIQISPILKLQLDISPNLDEKAFDKITSDISNEDYDRAIKHINKLKKSRLIKSKLKAFLK